VHRFINSIPGPVYTLMSMSEGDDCKVKLVSDPDLGYVLEHNGKCEVVLGEISKNLGPHGQKYLGVRLRKTADEPSRSNEATIEP